MFEFFYIIVALLHHPRQKRMRNMFLILCAQRNVLLSSRSTMETATTRIVKLVASSSPQFRENNNKMKERKSERARLLSFSVLYTRPYIFNTYENKIVFDNFRLVRSLIQKKAQTRYSHANFSR